MCVYIYIYIERERERERCSFWTIHRASQVCDSESRGVFVLKTFVCLFMFSMYVYYVCLCLGLFVLCDSESHGAIVRLCMYAYV